MESFIQYTIVIICIILFILIIHSMSKARKQEKTQRFEEMKKRNATDLISLPHLIGLSLPENTFCNIYLCPDYYEFEANGISFTLNKDKITDISHKTDIEIQKQLVSSSGGAVGGAMLFGPLGAIIGGRIKTQQLQKITECLIFTYIKDDNQLDYIAFDVTGNFFKIIKLLSTFEAEKIKNGKENKKIEL